jgi:hypothetical protein
MEIKLNEEKSNARMSIIKRMKKWFKNKIRTKQQVLNLVVAT